MAAENKTSTTKKIVFELRRSTKDFDIPLALDLTLPFGDLLKQLWPFIKQNLLDEPSQYPPNRQVFHNMPETEAIKHIQILTRNQHVYIYDNDDSETISDVLFYHQIPKESPILCQLTLLPPKDLTDIFERGRHFKTITMTSRDSLSTPTNIYEDPDITKQAEEISKLMVIFKSKFSKDALIKLEQSEENSELKKLEEFIANYWNRTISPSDIRTESKATPTAPTVALSMPTLPLPPKKPLTNSTPLSVSFSPAAPATHAVNSNYEKMGYVPTTPSPPAITVSPVSEKIKRLSERFAAGTLPKAVPKSNETTTPAATAHTAGQVRSASLSIQGVLSRTLLPPPLPGATLPVSTKKSASASLNTCKT
jgi:hypothetical protein